MSEEKILGTEGNEKTAEVLKEPESVTQKTETSPAPEIRAEKKPERLEGKFQEILSKVSASGAHTAHSDADAAADTKTIASITDEETKVQKLLDLAQSKGVVYAVKVAQNLGDYYALDRMHDDLADRLYEGLLARGLIQKD